jgi:hypothetical protein
MSEVHCFSYDGLIKAIEEGIAENGLDRNDLVFGIALPDGERLPVDMIDFVITEAGVPAIIFKSSQEPDDGEKEDVPLLRVA